VATKSMARCAGLGRRVVGSKLHIWASVVQADVPHYQVTIGTGMAEEPGVIPPASFQLAVQAAATTGAGITAEAVAEDIARGSVTASIPQRGTASTSPA
jgi:hypothetical protein